MLESIRSDPSFVVNFSENRLNYDSFSPRQTQKQPGETYSANLTPGAHIVGTVNWDPHAGMFYRATPSVFGASWGSMPPAVGLLHEFTHAADWVAHPWDPNNPLDRAAEERRVMWGSEARALERINEPAPRASHGDPSLNHFCYAESMTQLC